MADDYASSIDLSKLETQLRLAIEEDEKYKRENAAKFRAIEQSKTYEEFRNIVKASHLKPMDKRDSLDSKDMRPTSWNSYACKNLRNPDCGLVTSAITCASDTKRKSDDTLKSDLGYHNFHQFWLLFSENPEERLKLLEKTFIIKNIFKDHELSIDLIVEVIEMLNDSLSKNQKFSNKTYDLAIKVMISISSTPRFSLHMLFLSEKEKSITNQLKEKLKIYIEMKEKQEAPRGGINMSMAFLNSF